MILLTATWLSFNESIMKIFEIIESWIAYKKQWAKEIQCHEGGKTDEFLDGYVSAMEDVLGKMRFEVKKQEMEKE